MRFVLLGCGELTRETASHLVKGGHEVVIIEKDREKIDDAAESLDVSFIHGDGSKPNILEEAGPGHTDILFCLSDDDQDNIIASLVGRSLGYTRVVTRLQDAGFESICRELQLEETIVPYRTIGRHLADLAAGSNTRELSRVLRQEARLFTFRVSEKLAGSAGDLRLPSKARVIGRYREDRFEIAGDDAALQEGDEVLLVVHADALETLKDMFAEDEHAKS